ncbi:hypothetical protein AZI86_11525 [Bdellovibrio bacteriovorus]|uniref:Serine hydrolase family protein n=1 Tax=Bdellovibrio bacteriovorus TaxID=959 RepID=A0A150WLW9_BDEBC|nr:alpha/beta hydrolase [Bdellovibrio bacteriovorus]KYG64825.1 hypothetical protein AZI86_11525 [Bdellovibrio bacteriovorus]
MKIQRKLSTLIITLGLFIIPNLGIAKSKQLSANKSEKMKQAKVFINHGYMASPDSHWFPWLKKQIEKEGGQVDVLQMPETNSPKAPAWNEVLKKEIKTPNEHTYFVGHSLGCINLLNYLSSLPESTRIGGIICVSGFSESLPNLTLLNEFTAKKYDVNRLKKIAAQRVVIVAEDDQIVAPEITARLSKELEAPLHRIKKGGHFLDSDGFTEFPLVFSELKKMIEN